MSPSRSLLPLSLLVAACTPAQRPRPNAPPSLARSTGGAERAARVVLQPTGAIEPILSLDPEPPRFVVHGHRAELREGRWRLSEDRTTSGIRAVVRAGDRFVFLTEDGLVLASEDFLGPLTLLGALPGEVRAPFRSQGRLPILTQDGLYTADGRTLSRAGLTGARVHGAVFLDGDVGAAVREDGTLAFTSDGARTWREVALTDNLALGLVLYQGALRVTTARGPFSLSREGSLTRASAATEQAEVSLAGLEEARREGSPVLRAWHEAHPLPSMGDANHVRLVDGSYLSVGPESGVRRTDATHGLLSERPSDTPCAVYRWGARAAVRCGDALTTTSDGQRFEPLLLPPEACEAGLVSATFHDDGAHAAVRYRCPEGAGSEREVVYVRTEGGAWRGSTLPAELAQHRLAGVQGAVTLLLGPPPRGGAVLFDAVSGALTTVRLQGVDGEVTIPEGRVSPDGLFEVVAYTPAGPVLARGERGAPWPVVRLPSDAGTAAFVDAQRGLAVGQRLGQAWRTLDGGETWAPVPTGVEAPGEAPYLEDRPSVWCRADGCVAPGLLTMEGWGPLTLSSGRVWVSRLPRPGRVDDPVLPSLATMECSQGAPQPGPLASLLTSPWNQELFAGLDHPAVLRLEAGRATVVYQPSGGAARTVPLRQPNDALLVGLGAGLLVGEGDGFAWVRGGRHTSVRLGPGIVPFDLGPRSHTLSVATPRGGVAVLTSTLRALDPARTILDGPALQYDLAFEVDASGAVTGSTLRPLDDYRVRKQVHGLAILRGVVGRVAVGEDRQVRWSALRGGPEESLGALPSALTPCERSPARGATSVSFSLPQVISTEHWFGRARGRVMVDLGPGGACVRALLAGDDDRNLHRLEAQGGALIGHRDQGSERVSLRCEARPGGSP